MIRRFEMDWRKILWVYINHVGDCEGVDFLSNIYPGYEKYLTAEEVAALRDIASENGPDKGPLKPDHNR